MFALSAGQPSRMKRPVASNGDRLAAAGDGAELLSSASPFVVEALGARVVELARSSSSSIARGS